MHILNTANVIYDHLFGRIVKKSVDGEISADDILFFGTQYVISYNKWVGAVARAKGRCFDDFGAKSQVGKAKASAN